MRIRDHQSDGVWGFGVHTGMGRLGMLPGMDTGAQEALEGAGSVPWHWQGRERDSVEGGRWLLSIDSTKSSFFL